MSVFLQPNDRKRIPADPPGVVVVAVQTFESSQRQNLPDASRPEENFLDVFVDQVLLGVGVVDVVVVAVIVRVLSFPDFYQFQEIGFSQFVPVGVVRLENEFPCSFVTYKLLLDENTL